MEGDSLPTQIGVDEVIALVGDPGLRGCGTGVGETIAEVQPCRMVDDLSDLLGSVQGFVPDIARHINFAGFEIGNVDSTVVAQAPRLAPHIPAMRQRVAATG